MKNAVALIALSLVAACGPLVENTDKPSGVYIGGASPVSGGTVALAETAPRSGTAVEGISCKNKVWEPSPTNEAAIAVLQREAMSAGFNAVHVVKVEPVAAPIALNCWAAIKATGLAFNQ